jgi:hypothetical protein
MPFGRRPTDEEDGGEGLPKPLTVRAAARRAAGIKEAAEALAHLPAPGESVHLIFTARLDLSDLLACLLERLGHCSEMKCATLGYNRRNLTSLLGWLDRGMIGALSLVASIFFRSHNGDLVEETVAEFRARKQRVAFCPSHAKVVTMAFASGERLALEGSSNLCSSGSGREQIAIIADTALCSWHSRWIDDLVARHESKTT